ncbi:MULTISPECIES: TraR/DksA C4-type zinc finger protein [unclassified Halomonas]|uniref:TraR/DksA C4-type zinc finger protein n=1 Tax=unclassified Halomonas TaxID=2609666 RepID=UPI001CF46BE7|nr:MULTISPECIES: TraR/DksA C4-type zinc finger protein [unclassified Halomonas]MCA8865574.1 TraR/DksA family transcriptional regulator [Halomonas sp. SBBP1]UZH10432.1 TraR/DksA C4-type zinc finger protein [Halomonas sp. BDJS001]
MADNADRAAVTIQQSLEATLARRATLATQAANDDCEDCGYVIPAQRRKAAPWATTCIECQGIRELKNKQGR